MRVWKGVLEDCEAMVGWEWGGKRGNGVDSRGLLSLEEAEVQRDTFWTLQSSSSDSSSLPREESQVRLRGSKAEQAKGLPDRKLVTGFAFIAQGNGYKYARKSNYDSANRMGQNLSLSSNHSRRDKHGFILSYQLELWFLITKDWQGSARQFL